MSTQSIQPPTGGALLHWKGALALLISLAALLGIAGTASASSAFIANSYPATVTGTAVSSEKLVITYGNYTCIESKASTLSGTLNTAAKTLSTSPEWPGLCTGPLSSLAEFKANGCKFEFTATSGGNGEMAIGPAGCGPMIIQGQVGFCNIEIGPQSGLENQTTFTNEGSGSTAYVLAQVSLGNLKYTECGTKTHENGVYSGSWKLSGKTSGGSSDGLSITEAFEIAPTVKTGLTEAVSATSAKLHGSVNPNYLSTTYQFEYGTTSSYGSKAPVSPASLEAGGSSVEVGETLSGLSSNTTYHYRLVATNSKGTIYGKDRTFNTIASGATAAEIYWPSGTTQLTASASSQWQKLVITSGTLQCQEVTGNVLGVSGTRASGVPLEELAYHNKESKPCEGPFGTTPVVKTNGCSYEFHVGESIGSKEAKGSVTIGKCASEEAIVASASGCSIALPQFQTMAPATYKTVGSNVEVVMALKGVSYIRTGFLCGTAAESNGAYTGSILLKGNNGSIYIE